MSKKYLSLEEAAQQLGVGAAELNRLREKGMIRAFADRGTWKFKEEDVEKLGRSRQADSDPDVPLHTGGKGDSAIDDDDVLGEQETIISKPLGDDSSDSDVRLIFDDAMKVEDSHSGSLLDDSDSDVKLAPSAGAAADDSDSDVKLAGTTPGTLGGQSDSDVKLVTDDIPTQDAGSDSDVRLVSSDSSGEVKLAGGSSGSVAITGPDDADATIGLEPADESVLDDDSGISLAGGSGIALASDSGISLERPNDSGISLSEESSLVLGDDSGISLTGDSPLKSGSGISLAGDLPLKSGSGISLSKQAASDKKKKKDVAKAAGDSDDLSGTVPLMDMPVAPEEDLFDTQMEVPNLGDSSESNDLFSGPGSDTANVITLDDEDQSYDVTADIPTRGGAALEDEDEAAVADETEEEPMEVDDDLVGEDDELSEDVFGAEDEDFADDQVESGESLSELPVSPRGMVAAAEQDWGAPTHTALVLSTVLLVACGTVLFDMVRNMWHTDTANHNPIASALLDMFRGI